MSDVRIRSQIGKEDLHLWDGVETSFERRSSTGGKVTLRSVGNYVDVLAVYGDGSILDGRSIARAVDAIGSTNKVGLMLAPGIWHIDADLTIPSNLSLWAPPGAEFNTASGKTLTIGAFKAGLYQVFSGDGSVVFGTGAVKEAYPQWWFGADIVALQAALDSTTSVNISGGVFDLEYGFVDVSADARIFGDGIIIGGLTINGDNVRVRDITVQQTTGLDGGNLARGITSTDFGNLIIENVTFDVSSLGITNGASSYKYGYKVLGCTFTGNVSADAYAGSMAGSNVDSIEIRGNLFEQSTLYRVIKLSSSGYGIAPDVVDDNYNKRGIISGNFFRGAIGAGAKQIMDLYSSFTELIITDNEFLTTGGNSVILTKASGGEGPNTSQHRNILIANNIVITDADVTIFLLTGAWEQDWEDIEQNITIANNQITISNNSATRGIQVRSYNRAVIADNDIYYTGSADPFYAIAVRHNEETNISGGLLKRGIIALEADTSGNININGVSLVEHKGRGVDLNGITAGSVNIGACNFASAAQKPIRIRNATLDSLTVVGNISTNFELEDGGGNTIAEFTHIANSWDGIEEHREGAGAISIIRKTTRISTDGVDALTLADGWEGQEKFIYMSTDEGDGTLTPENFAAGDTITFDAVGESAHLLFSNGEWHFMGGTATVA